MRPTVTTSSAGGGFPDLKAKLERLKKANVYVGVPEDKNARKDPAANNASLLYLFSKGSPRAGIPPRPVIEPALQAADNKANIARELAEAAKGVLAGKPQQASAHLKRAGMLGRNAAIRWFVDPRNGWAPNRPATIARKGSDRPGIDTAQMRRSITYVVEE